MTAEARIDLLARRAAEEFLAAGRAPCPDARARHRRSALEYADLLRAVRERPAQFGRSD